jgi:hypothetical protein
MAWHRVSGRVFVCDDCNTVLATRSGFGGRDFDWFMVKDKVWQHGQLDGACRFLCVGCLENRLGRKLKADDFRRSAKVNFVGQKSPKLRRRMRGLKPARRLVNTRFNP